MTDDTKPIPTIPFVERLRAPVIFFDGAPTMAAFNGIIALTVSAAFYEPGADGQLNIEQGTVAHLRTNIVGAKLLRDALDKALLLAQPVEGQKN